MTDSSFIARCALVLAGFAACTGAWAQSSPLAPSAAASAAADRAQKETDRTMYWIRVLSDKPVAKPAAPKPAPVAAAPAPAPQAKPVVTAATAEPRERAKAASTAAAPPSGSGDVSSVVTAVPAAAAPSLAAATGAGSTGNTAAMSSGSLDAGIAASGLAGALAAPTASAPQLDIAPPEVEEPDPGLIMTKSADPQFPMATMRRLRKGEVEVKFEVGPDGVVDVVTVMKTTHNSLNAAAVDAVRQWRFKPTPKGHTALVDLAFNLDS
jgi:protein TonB